MKKIVIINGHPDSESFSHALHKAYREGALSSSNDVKEIVLSDMSFNPILQFGYRQRTDLEADLQEAWEKIKWAEHLVWIFPIWWGGMPALLKGFIDRLFLPGFAFEYQPETRMKIPKPLLEGRTSEIICTMNSPIWYYKFLMGSYGTKLLSKSVLAFCGVKNKRTKYFTIVKDTNEEQFNKMIVEIRTIGSANS